MRSPHDSDGDDMAENDTTSTALELEARKSSGGIERRDFLNEIAGAALGVAAAGAAVVTIRYLSPNVLFEPPTSFRVGTPDNFAVNSVSYFADQQVYIIRGAMGFFALSAVCTHLGCITQWNPDLDLIACPCHGSRFSKDGKVVHGPAPRSLSHFAMRLMPDGTLLVDKLEIVPESLILKV
jgi:cytochrome b6-f complex iron-sulfur subunit